MSEELKRKLLSYEVDPPEKTWSSIRASLDEEMSPIFSRKIYWAQAEPPVNTWEKIATVLDGESADPYLMKLYNFEVEPPAGTWDKISSALNPAKLTSSKGKIISLVKYAAAACILGIMVLGALKLFTQRNDDAVAAKLTPQKNPVPKPQTEDKKLSDEPRPSISNNLPKEKAVIAKANYTSKKSFYSHPGAYMNDVVSVSYPDLKSSQIDFQQVSLSRNVHQNNIEAGEDRYLLFLNPQGYFVRISKKLAQALGCLYTNGNSEEYQQCQEQVNKWREKISKSQVNPSADNFMGILELVKSIQDNKEL